MEAQVRADSTRQVAEANLRQLQEARYNEIVKRADGYLALNSLEYAKMEYEFARYFRLTTLQDSLPDNYVESKIDSITPMLSSEEPTKPTLNR